MSMFFMSSMRDEIEEIENNTPIAVCVDDAISAKWKKLLKLARHLGGTDFTWSKSSGDDYDSSKIRDFLDSKLNIKNCFNLNDDEIEDLIQKQGELNDSNK